MAVACHHSQCSCIDGNYCLDKSVCWVQKTGVGQPVKPKWIARNCSKLESITTPFYHLHVHHLIFITLILLSPYFYHLPLSLYLSYPCVFLVGFILAVEQLHGQFLVKQYIPEMWFLLCFSFCTTV